MMVFRMNKVLASLWYIMGLWPLVYSMLLLLTGRRQEQCKTMGCSSALICWFPWRPRWKFNYSSMVQKENKSPSCMLLKALA
ncbi:hypothetical protein DEO72_LG11g1707 [Vigna unguiculata]|uniref:Uncharacterized protein n=1 Tax=Vigna unguiculata TaxID=3917 RepID=A0A4D6NLM2_VIGUN|nr:hypothetical protein DEO72_LG11g1707 [Vigna unguiculata]